MLTVSRIAVRTVFCVRAHALAFPPIVSINCVTIAPWDESAHGPCRSNPFPIGGAWLMSARRSVRLASLKRAGNEQAATTEAHAKEPGQRQQDQGGLDSLATTFRERVARVSLVYMVRRGCTVSVQLVAACCSNATAIVETGAISFDRYVPPGLYLSVTPANVPHTNLEYWRVVVCSAMPDGHCLSPAPMATRSAYT